MVEVKSAFDAGTGIIKEHRGKGLAGKMFEFAVPLLKDQCISKFWLEVLQVNEKQLKHMRKQDSK
ncbi:MAG: GNAT family N-acetyltransferase [Marinilabiliales bacterium]|nr:GNAT family N-acetyltransferase [Marinilabiliales bacterium]